MGKASFRNELLLVARAMLRHPEKLLLGSVFSSHSDYSMEAGGQGGRFGRTQQPAVQKHEDSRLNSL